MNKYIRNNFFHCLLYPCLTILFYWLFNHSIHSSYSLPYEKGIFLWCLIYSFIHSININKAYLIKNDHFICKQVFKTTVIDLNDLKDFYIEKKFFETIYIFCFSNKKYKIYKDNKMKVLIDYFLENHIEEFYKRKFLQYDLLEKNKSNKFIFKLILHMLFGFLLFFSGIFSIYKMLLLGGKDIFYIISITVILIQGWRISLSEILDSRIFFTKEGLYFKKYIIQYNEIKRIIEFEKKILAPKGPIFVKSLRIITEVEEIVIKDNLTSNQSLYKYVREKINQKERIIINRNNEVSFC